MDLSHRPLITRRRVCMGGALLLAHGAVAANGDAARAAARSSHFPFGAVVPPRMLDAWPVTTHRGAATELGALLAGQVTAVQLMFTGCSATCPIQGALFSAAQRAMQGGQPAAQFVSVSIDALGDSPAALAAWLKKFDAMPGWLAAVPRPRDVDAIVERLGSGGEKRPPAPDPHTGQVYVFDRRARLVYRTPSMPTPAQIVTALREVAALG